MKLSVEANVLKSALNAVKNSVGKGDMPILSTVLITPGEDTLKIQAFNGVQATVKSIPCDFFDGEKRAIAVNHDLITKIVSKLSDILELTVNEEGTQLEFRNDSCEFQLNLNDADEFPELPVLDEDGTGFDWEAAAPIFASVVPVASIDLSKQVLTGVSLREVDGVTELAATDSHRLIVMQLGELITNESIVIPRELVNAVLSAFKGESVVSLAHKDNLIKFSSETTTVVGFSIAGDFPAYERLIPTNFQQELTIGAKDLLEAIDLVAPLSATNNLVVSLTISEANDSVKLETRSDIGHAQSEVGAGNIKQDLEIAFNQKYLQNGLKGLDGEFQLKLNSWNQPALIVSQNYTYLIMPLQLRK
ncbi:DNA polymerase III subunit beta [Myxosarcina sp. GI1(2024)]